MPALKTVCSSPGPQEKKEEPSHVETAAPSSFEFVTFSDLGSMRSASAKSQIRKHAMKDIGVTRRRPNKRRKGYVNVPIELLADVLSPHPASTGISYDGVDPFLNYPVELDYQGKKLVANMFGPAQRALRDDWFTVALMAAPAFNQALANSALQYETTRVSQTFERSAMCYHQLAISSIRTQLERLKGHPTDEVIGSVSALVCWNAIRGNGEEWNVQLYGMLSLINSYPGGLQAIARNHHLRSTMSWVELRGAYMLDLPPQLPLPETWVLENDKPRYNDPMALDLGEHWVDSHSSHSSALRIYQDLVSFSRQAADEISVSFIDSNALKLPLWTNVVIYELLKLRPLDSLSVKTAKQADLVAEAFRLAMLLYMAPIWRFYGSHPAHTRTAVRKLHQILEAALGILNSSPSLQKLQAWVLCMGAFEADVAEEQDLRQSFVSALAKHSLPEVRILESARGVLWIHGLFDQQAAALEEDITRVRSTGHSRP